MPHPNSILQLREQELAQSTQVFRARGARVVRCQRCLLPQANCICTAKPAVRCNSAFCFIMHKGEAYKPSNTGRLIADIAPDNHAFLWQRTQHHPQLLQLLADPDYAPILVFPHEYAKPDRCIHSLQQVAGIQAGKKPLFVMLDGTWREAKRMFKSPYLADLPVLGVQPERASSYLLRDAALLHQLCTVEVGIEVLKRAQEEVAAHALANYFAVFCQQYAIIRPHILDKKRAGHE